MAYTSNSLLPPGVGPDLMQLDVMRNSAGPHYNYLNSQSLLAGMPTSGVPTDSIANAYEQITSYVQNPFRPNSGNPTNDSLVTNQTFNQLEDVNNSVDNMDIHTKEVIQGTTVQSGEFIHTVAHFDSEESQMIRVTNEREELQFSNRSNMCVNTPAANGLLAQWAIRDQLEKGTMDKVVGRGYKRRYMMDIRECVERTRPFGFLTFEVNLRGGVSRVFKSGIGSGYSSYPTDEIPTILAKIVHDGDHQVMSGIVPPDTRVASRIFMACVPTKVQNGTVYKTGGMIASPTHIGEEKFAELLSLSKNPNMVVNFGPKYGANAFMYIPQWQILTSLDGGFNPNNLCPIDWSLQENQALREEGEPWTFSYPGYFQQIGILRNPMHSSYLPTVANPDMIRASRDYEYRSAALGGCYDEGNQFTIINTGTCGFFG